MNHEQKQPVLKVSHLKQHFRVGHGKNKLVVKAVDDVSFEIYRGEVFSLVGESGCGKTTTGRTIIKLYEPTDGEVFFMDRRISAGVESIKLEIKKLRAEFKKQELSLKNESNSNSEKIVELKNELNEKVKLLKQESNQRLKDTANVDVELMKKMQMIFQDPIASLNPRMTVKEIIAEGLRIAGVRNNDIIIERVNKMLETVGMLPEHASRYPHEFSGGQRQRIGIARALAVSPDFIIADEPISALDVSIQAQVINLLNDLRDAFGITIMFIAHDLSVVKYFSDRIGVMYYGKLVELASKEELFKNPIHPYTRSLLSAVPLPDPNYEKKRVRIKYEPSKVHDYSKEGPKLHEILPGHFVYANTDELKVYEKSLKTK